MSSKQLKNLLNPSENGDLSELVQRAQAMSALTSALSRSLPPELAGGVVAANIREDGELVVVARSPAWAARLRFEAENMLSAARSDGHPATACTVRVSHGV